MEKERPRLQGGSALNRGIALGGRAPSWQETLSQANTVEGQGRLLIGQKLRRGSRVPCTPAMSLMGIQVASEPALVGALARAAYKRGA